MTQDDEGLEAPGGAPQVMTVGAPAVGEVLADRYRLEHHAGDDSLGRQLWQGIDVILRRPVAVVLRYPGGDSAAEMLSAAVAASRIVHPHLVGVYDAIDEGGRAYVVREWVEGEALRDLVAEAPLDPGRAAAITAGVAEAVAALHATGFAHGNVHPGTVLIGNDGRVVLTDTRADETVSTEADLRAIGAVLYCALTGHWPHAEAGPTAVPDAVRDGSGQLIAPRQFRAGIPAHLDEVAMVLLQGEMYQITAEAVAIELGGGEPHGDSGFVEDEGTLTFTSYEAGYDQPHQQLAPPPPSGGRKIMLGVAILVAIAIVGVFAASWIFAPSVDNTDKSAAGVTGNAGQPANGEQGPLKVASVRVVDNGQTTRTELANAARATDGNLETQWGPDRYVSPQFGNLKKGMGLLLDLGEARTVRQVQVQLSAPHSSLELRGGDDDPGSSPEGDQAILDSYKQLADPKPDPQTNAVFTVTNDTQVRYVLLWITKLPPDNQGRFYVGVQEITVTGQ